VAGEAAGAAKKSVEPAQPVVVASVATMSAAPVVTAVHKPVTAAQSAVAQQTTSRRPEPSMNSAPSPVVALHPQPSSMATSTTSGSAARMMASPVVAETVVETVVETAAEVVVTETAVAETVAKQRITLLDLTPALWCDVAEALTLTGVARNIVNNCALVAVKPETLILALDEAQATLFNDAARDRITQAVSDYFAVRMRVDISVAALPAETAAQRRVRLRDLALQKARLDIEADPNVQLLVSQFAASIDFQSITPVDSK